MRIADLAVVFLAASLLAGCAAGQHGGQSQAPLPNMHAAAVVLDGSSLPPQGATFRDTSNRWQVHGVIDKVVYRFGETDRTHLFVANRAGIAWTALTAQNSWSISCVSPGPDVRCTIESPTGRLAMVDGTVCRVGGHGGAADTISMSDGRTCVRPADSARVQQDLMAGRDADHNVSGYGFRQAVNLRDWMIRISKTSRQK